MKLCENEAFYYVDQNVDGRVFRVFTYRLASYTEFCLPNALECRGHTFLMNGDDPVELVSLPPAKFFNVFENPMVMDIDVSKALIYMDKMDGSLISSVKDIGAFWGFRLKSKTSFTSSQAVEAEKMLTDDSVLRNWIYKQVMMDRTVSMEYCSPHNRIVISYTEPKLTILNVRDNKTGETFYPHDLWHDEIARRYLVNYVSNLDVSYTYEQILSMTGIEGFVALFDDGRVVKIKTSSYCIAHKIKDKINNPKALFEACLYETSDDLRSIFHDDELALKKINEMEALVRHEYNHRFAQLQAFYEENKFLSRKDYAILGQSVLKDGTFSLAMNLYLGRDIGLKDWMMKNYRMFGISDTVFTTNDFLE
jgi:T4 RnlA family RNA ligase